MDGIINIYKEKGYTSFDVVAKLRGILHMRKIGHTGTLDPMAEGVLPVCVGNATKLCDILTDHDKVYEAEMVLGVTYDTQDITGNMLMEHNVMLTNSGVPTFSSNTECAGEQNSNAVSGIQWDKDTICISENQLTEAIKSFEGGYEQTPPMYSAKKVDGKKLYELAREGKEIERKSVHVDIYQIDILKVDMPRVSIRVHCGKGTYIRALIDDIGRKLSCGAAMSKLLRTKVGEFDIAESIKLDTVEEYMKTDRISEQIKCVDKVFSECKAVTIPEKLCKLLYNGNSFGLSDFSEIDNDIYVNPTKYEKIRVYDFNGRFYAVYEYNSGRKSYKPYKMFL